MAASSLGDFFSPVLDSTNKAWLHYNIGEADGTNELTVDVGTISFWFAPNWSSTNEGGTGPGEWSRLIEVGSFTTNAAYGWWSIYTDPAGANIYFSAQSNDGSGGTYISAPIAWTTNYWHMIAVTYSSTNSSLYLDGELVTNGLPVTVWPSSDVLSNGFYIGSDSNGWSQAHGMFDDMYTYNFEIDADTVSTLMWSREFFYYGNPENAANIISAPSTPSSTPIFNAITGPGYLMQLSNTVSCVTNASVWITNVVVTPAANGTRNLAFTIAGGADTAFYDVFANSVLDFSTNTAAPWAWMGQGNHCTTYLLTNLPSAGSVFLILGGPQDSDADGLTDAFEKLVSKTRPDLWDTDRDGMGDGWEIVFGTNPTIDDTGSGGAQILYDYNPAGWLDSVTGTRSEAIGLDRESNVQLNSQP